MCDRAVIDAAKRALSHGGVGRASSLRDLQSSRQRVTVAVPPSSFSFVVDLTHTLTADFPSYFGKALDIETIQRHEDAGFKLQRITYAEHVGTHFDAPLHFSEDGLSVDEIPIAHLVCPLVIIDVRRQVAADEDYRLTPADITSFEAEHGPIPRGSCVAMFSGWEAYLGTARFRNLDQRGVCHFPGFHEEAADFLLRECLVHGIAVDTMSLDHGASSDSRVHNIWLPAGRYGIENVANLGLLPPLGATLIAGAPKMAGATGGPGRVLALIP